jgi:hypothetical protein
MQRCDTSPPGDPAPGISPCRFGHARRGDRHAYDLDSARPGDQLGQANGLRGRGGDPISFAVSADGKSVLDVVPPVSNACGPAGTLPPTHGKISHGALMTVSGVTGFNRMTIKGIFLAGGRARGTVSYAGKDFLGASCHYVLHWKAAALPPGTKPCTNHGHLTTRGGRVYTDITVQGTSCAVVDKALDKSKGNEPRQTFSTLGWTCRSVSSSSLLYIEKCIRAKPTRATFTFR